LRVNLAEPFYLFILSQIPVILQYTLSLFIYYSVREKKLLKYFWAISAQRQVKENQSCNFLEYLKTIFLQLWFSMRAPGAELSSFYFFPLCLDVLGLCDSQIISRFEQIIMIDVIEKNVRQYENMTMKKNWNSNNLNSYLNSGYMHKYRITQNLSQNPNRQVVKW